MADDAVPPGLHPGGLGGRRHPADDDGLLKPAPPDRGEPDWLGEIPLDPGPPHVRIGTKRVDEAVWLLPDENRSAELAIKRRLLTDRRTDVVATADAGPATLRAQTETRSLVTAWLRRHRPDLSTTVAPLESGMVGSTPAGSEPGAPDLEAAALLVQEDLCLMRVGDGSPVLVAAVVCFPSHWRLADKIGRPMAAIHDQVPDYVDTLADRPDRVLEHLAPDRIVARRNWSVHDGAALFAPERPQVGDLGRAEVPDRLVLRSERQTLRRLPTGDHVLFTIRVQQVGFDRLQARPDVAGRLAAAIRSEAPRRLDRIAGAHVTPALDWLGRIA